MTRRPALLCLLILTAGSACGGPSSTSLTLTTATGAQLPAEAHAVVWLWGFDDRLADSCATLIATYQPPVGAVPITLELDIPDDPAALITQDTVGDAPVPDENARFYFSIYIDADNDSQICAGDFRQDFDVTDMQFYDDPPGSLEVAVLQIAAPYTCRPVPPDLSCSGGG